MLDPSGQKEDTLVTWLKIAQYGRPEGGDASRTDLLEERKHDAAAGHILAGSAYHSWCYSKAPAIREGRERPAQSGRVVAGIEVVRPLVEKSCVVLI